jgi:hypothetical protein
MKTSKYTIFLIPGWRNDILAVHRIFGGYEFYSFILPLLSFHAADEETNVSRILPFENILFFLYEGL